LLVRKYDEWWNDYPVYVARNTVATTISSNAPAVIFISTVASSDGQ
jgi:hypothetical protein